MRIRSLVLVLSHF